jgi:hypothetical protein
MKESTRSASVFLTIKCNELMTLIIYYNSLMNTMDHKKTGWEGVDWMQLAQDRDQ